MVPTTAQFSHCTPQTKIKSVLIPSTKEQTQQAQTRKRKRQPKTQPSKLAQTIQQQKEM